MGLALGEAWDCVDPPCTPQRAIPSAAAVPWNEALLRWLLDLSLTTSPATNVANHWYASAIQVLVSSSLEEAKLDLSLTTSPATNVSNHWYASAIQVLVSSSLEETKLD